MADNTSTQETKSPSGNFDPKTNRIESKISQLKEGFSEIVEIRKFLVEKNLNRISKAGTKDVVRALIPSLILLIFSLFVDVAYVPFFGDVAANLAKKLFQVDITLKVVPMQFWWLPFFAYILFLIFAWASNHSLKKQIALKGPSAEIITRIVDNYSGLVDSISTAMPLLGAAILLLSTQLGEKVFLGFSVPFEIKSIVILALGKLFGTVFETQGLQYQAITEEVGNIEEEYNFYNQFQLQNRLLDSIRSTNEQMITGLTGAGGTKQLSKEDAEVIFKYLKMAREVNEEHAKNIGAFKVLVEEFNKIKLSDSAVVGQMNEVVNNINNAAAIVKKTAEYSEIMKNNFETMKGISGMFGSIKMPDGSALAELQKTAAMVNETVTNLKDSNALKSLENLVYLTGKRQ
ncbi:MAG: hypothetical protein PHN88_14580 [Ignavibacteria bacterium]|nr:hypothetical protein [Ignavibacteria bacterium]